MEDQFLISNSLLDFIEILQFLIPAPFSSRGDQPI
jgi:hypothetical protein